jgi:predicted NUDIX family phosphoesterase
MAQEEQVLVIERKVFEKAGVFEGLAFDVEHYLKEIFAPGVPRFMKRPLAEKDPSFKQLIPYVIMSCDGKYLSYVRGRRAGETRLVGLRSIGIGGHINPADSMPLYDNSFYNAYLDAVSREVAEEVTIQSSYTNRVVALLNDESNEVGSVHLGIVHHWLLDSPQVVKREQMITQMSFMTPYELRAVRDSMETWSGLCLDHISQIHQHTASG